MKRYPKKVDLRKTLDNYITSEEIKSFYKKKGLLIHSFRKDDVISMALPLFLSLNDYNEIKQIMDDESNYKKSTRLHISTENLEQVESALKSLCSKQQSSDTKLRLINRAEEQLNFELVYVKHKPGKVDLLDRVERKINVHVNKNNNGVYNLDFNHSIGTDYTKIKKLVDSIKEEDPDLDFDLTEILLNSLSYKSRISLFEKFFNSDHNIWEIKEIKKLKVERDDNQKEFNDKELEGIKTALLSGKHLKENELVKKTLEDGFYFSRSIIRFDHKDDAEFIDLKLNFKSRPEMCEMKITNSGQYEKDNNDKVIEKKKMLSPNKQNEILNLFQSKLYQIYVNLKENDDLTEINVEA